jgi:hypothetical protein
MPDLAVELESESARFLFLVCAAGTATARIERESDVATRARLQRSAIAGFSLRAEQFNELVRAGVDDIGLTSIKAESSLDDQIADAVLYLT